MLSIHCYYRNSSCTLVPETFCFCTSFLFGCSTLSNIACFDFTFNRYQLTDQLLCTPEESSFPTVLLLETTALLLDAKMPWALKTASYILQQNVFTLFRGIVLAAKVRAMMPLILEM